MQAVAGNQRQIGVGVSMLAAVFAPGLLTAGCYYASPSYTPPMSSDGIDAGADAGADSGAGSAGSSAGACFGTAPFRVCLASAPTDALILPPGGTIDTADPSACVDTVPAGSTGCVLVGTTITVDAKLRAFGPRPLVLIASETLTITRSGSIDVGSHGGTTTAQELGAGADPPGCGAGHGPDNGGGGAGGSFVGSGGKGGDSQLFASTLWGGTPGPPVASEITQLRGGCAGQSGGGSSNGRSRGGHGGGAVLLIAGRAIGLIDGGSINAAGEGGEGGLSSPASGGGGGGSGGMIVLAAPTISSSGLILASGGGGGGGRGSMGSGTAGAGPSAVSPAAGGGGGPDDGGGGGAGSTRVINARGSDGSGGHTENGAALGGGGGGGTGIVKALGVASLGSQVSPPLQTP